VNWRLSSDDQAETEHVERRADPDPDLVVVRVVNLRPGKPVAAGVYVIRLTQDGRSITRKAVVAR